MLLTLQRICTSRALVCSLDKLKRSVGENTYAAMS